MNSLIKGMTEVLMLHSIMHQNITQAKRCEQAVPGMQKTTHSVVLSNSHEA